MQCANPQPIAELVPERQAELLAGFHQAEHAVARLSTVAANRAARNLSLNDEAAQISLRSLREAVISATAALRGKGKINFGMASFNHEQTMAVGEAWVGSGYRVTSSGFFESADGLR